MANEKQLEILKSGVKAWNEWRSEHSNRRIDLRSADLRSADLSHANLREANLSHANLRGANLSHVSLLDTNLFTADLSGANLTYTVWISAYCSGANFSSASLYYAQLAFSRLPHAEFLGARFGDTGLHGLDLSGTGGLAGVRHFAPTGITNCTLEYTAAGLAKDASRQGEVETFYRASGVPEQMIEYYRSLIGHPIEFYSAFISYNHSDKPFARRLYADLQSAGIRCWLDEKDMRGGDMIFDVVNRAIRTHDKLILLCSLSSLTSNWVERELQSAFDREERSKDGERILIPLDLDGYLFDGYEGQFGPQIRARLAIKFDGWKGDADVYEAGFEKVKDALRPQSEDTPPE